MGNFDNDFIFSFRLVVGFSITLITKNFDTKTSPFPSGEGLLFL